jgi:hypothetical protein
MTKHHVYFDYTRAMAGYIYNNIYIYIIMYESYIYICVYIHSNSKWPMNQIYGKKNHKTSFDSLDASHGWKMGCLFHMQLLATG